jgi:hypothetical protein
MLSTCPPSAKRFGEFMRTGARDGWLAKNKPDYSGILMKLSLGALRTRQMAADSSPGIPAILRQCFTNWLFRELGAFETAAIA